MADQFRSLLAEVAARPESGSSVLADRDQQCSLAALPGFIEAIQHELAARGITPGDCIALELNNSVRAALCALALLDAGASFITLPAPGLGARKNERSAEYPAFCRWVVTASPERPKQSLESTRPSEMLSVEPNLAFDSAARIPAEDEPKLFFRTSGSLGLVKLASFRYESFYRYALTTLKVRRFNAGHRIALPVPIFHNYGLGSGLLGGLAGGSSIDLQERSNVLRYFERESAFEPNVVYVTPSFCEMLIRSRRSPRPYEFMITSGDRTSESTFKRSEDLHGTMISQYGATEMGLIAAADTGDSFETRSSTVGRPVDGVTVRIAPIEGAMESEAGELQIRHANGFEGYVDLRGERVVPSGTFDGDWYRTRDLAKLNEDGTLSVLGRCDLSINRSGVLLPLADVESRMRELPSVEDVAVVAVGDKSLRGGTIVAFCSVTDPSATSGRQLRSRFAAMAPAYAVPDTVRVLPALPKLPSGKIDRITLARMAEEVPS